MRMYAHKGYVIGGILVVFILTLLSLSDTYQWRMPGPLNTGHEKLQCNECHELAKHGFRAQIQANIDYLFGKRTSLVSFNFESPGNKDCLSCHEREDDNHPVYRFNEPRFSDARKAIVPQYCTSCHKEHSGVRVSSDIDYCQHCHEDIEVKNDPLDISHADLVVLKDWHTCLACHDFHGNHIMKVATKIKYMKAQKLIKNYFAGGKDPYSEKKYEQSQETRYDNKPN
ncbi:hypothetical protein MNBD_GAMMA23-2507 [hydrothermal vent metagenome]|uniref:Tetrahaem cytochrome domain-containing protein n=1 Tax=hydrothermal vent metagenome TaxID=652676 RepID=A0A3B1ACU7_9ZZZZ